MKKILFLFMLALAVSLFTVYAGAATQWTFDNQSTINDWTFQNCEVKLYENVLELTATGTDPTMTVFYPDRVNLSEYKYIALRMKTESDLTKAGFFFGTGSATGVSGATYSEFILMQRDKWQKYVIDMSSYSHGLWTGNLSVLRLDPINGSVPSGNKAYIAALGLFKTEEEAYEFLGMQATPNDKPEWFFTNDAEMGKWSFTDSTGKIENETLSITPTGMDVYISRVLSSGEKVDCSEYKYVAFNFKTDTTIKNGGIFFAVEGNAGYSDTRHMPFTLNADGEWHSYVVDMSSNANWKGTLSRLRIDPQNGASLVNAMLMFERIGVFKTAEDARAFLESERVEDFNGLYWTFDNEKSLDDWEFSGVKSEFMQNVLYLRNYDHDPIMANDNIPSGYDCTQYKYVAFNMNTNTDITHGLVFFATSKDTSLNDSKYVRFNTIRDGEWHDYIVDMTANVNWKNNLTILRLDPQNGGGEAPDDIYIGRIGLFKTEKEAQRFLDAQKYPVPNEAPTPQWVFGPEADADIWDTYRSFYDESFGVSSYSATATDIQLRANLNSQYDAKKQRFSADKYKYFALKYNFTSVSGSGKYNAGLFFTNESGESYNNTDFKSFSITADSTYHEVIVDMSSVATWTGDIYSLRFDPINYNNAGDNFVIARMGFFETQEKAQAFLDADESMADFDSLYENRLDDLKLIIPSGTLDYGYNIYDYMMSSTTPTGSGNYPIVVREDEEGELFPVALGDVNSAGYVRYVTDKKGTYCVMYNDTTFSDIKSHWAKESIEYIAAREVMLGTSAKNFSPDLPMTRAMFITALGRMHGIDTDAYTGNGGCSDVNTADYYAPYAVWAMENGIMDAASDGCFAPEEPITRADVAVAAKNYIECYGFNIKATHFSNAFNDISSCTDQQRKAIEYIASTGVMVGEGDKLFAPEGILTRAEASAVITRLIKSVVGAHYINGFDRSKFLISAFGFNTYVSTPQGVQDLIDMDVDYLMAGSANKKLLRLLEEYNLAYIPSGRLHSWWGDNGQNAGTYDDVHSPDDVAKELEKAPKSEAIVGDYIVDEPSAWDYEGINEVFLKYTELTQGKTFPFVNLYPNYGKLYDPADPTALSQLGTETYLQYVQEYVEHMDNDYICFDNYPLGSEGSFKKYLHNLDDVASECRKHGRDMWVIIQSGQWEGRTPVTLQQLEWQMYLCMAYGTTSIIHACYTPQWWGESLSCIQTDGTKNPMYYYAQSANREIHRMSDEFMKYSYLGTYGVGYGSNTASNIKSQLVSQNQRNADRDGFDGIDGVTVTSDAGCAVGCFENKYGNALMLVNCRDPFNVNDNTAINVTLTIDEVSGVTAYENGNARSYTADASGKITISIPCGEGVFVTFDK